MKSGIPSGGTRKKMFIFWTADADLQVGNSQVSALKQANVSVLADNLSGKTQISELVL